jgi:hypothetical protein
MMQGEDTSPAAFNPTLRMYTPATGWMERDDSGRFKPPAGAKPEPTKVLTARVPGSLLLEVDQTANQEGISRSALVTRILQAWLAGRG